MAGEFPSSLGIFRLRWELLVLWGLFPPPLAEGVPRDPVDGPLPPLGVGLGWLGLQAGRASRLARLWARGGLCGLAHGLAHGLAYGFGLAQRGLA